MEEEIIVRDRSFNAAIAAAVAALACVGILLSTTRTPAQAPALKTPWGEPDLQGIWTDETDTPFQRSTRCKFSREPR